MDLLVVFLSLIILIPSVRSCSSRSTPQPRSPLHSTAIRPDITFQTYACPPAYAAWYCLNGATCFAVKIAESILYNCECADGYMGQRCEFKDPDGSYLPARKKKLLLLQSPGFGLTFLCAFGLVILAAAIGAALTKHRTRYKLKTIQNKEVISISTSKTHDNVNANRRNTKKSTSNIRNQNQNSNTTTNHSNTLSDSNSFNNQFYHHCSNSSNISSSSIPNTSTANTLKNNPTRSTTTKSPSNNFYHHHFTNNITINHHQQNANCESSRSSSSSRTNTTSSSTTTTTNQSTNVVNSNVQTISYELASRGAGDLCSLQIHPPTLLQLQNTQIPSSSLQGSSSSYSDETSRSSSSSCHHFLFNSSIVKC